MIRTHTKINISNRIQHVRPRKFGVEKLTDLGLFVLLFLEYTVCNF